MPFAFARFGIRVEANERLELTCHGLKQAVRSGCRRYSSADQPSSCRRPLRGVV